MFGVVSRMYRRARLSDAFSSGGGHTTNKHSKILQTSPVYVKIFTYGLFKTSTDFWVNKKLHSGVLGRLTGTHLYK